jgi:LPS export ABC transporter protein LptC
VIFISVALAFVSCSQSEKTVPQLPVAGKVPDSILQNATIVITSAGLRKALIVADTLFVFEKEDSTAASKIKVDFYNDQGVYQSTLTAMRGLVRQKQQTFFVWGDVVVKNDTSKIESQSLQWDAKRNLITTDDFVRFERRNDIISGYGLEADSKLENVRILRDVKGRLSDVPNSEQELDSLEKPHSKTAP